MGDPHATPGTDRRQAQPFLSVCSKEELQKTINQHHQLRLQTESPCTCPLRIFRQLHLGLPVPGLSILNVVVFFFFLPTPVGFFAVVVFSFFAAAVFFAPTAGFFDTTGLGLAATFFGAAAFFVFVFVTLPATGAGLTSG